MIQTVRAVFFVLALSGLGCNDSSSNAQRNDSSRKAETPDLGGTTKQHEFTSFSFQIPHGWVVAPSEPPREATLRRQSTKLPIPIGMVDVAVLPETTLTPDQLAERFAKRFSFAVSPSQLVLDGVNAITFETDSTSLDVPRHVTIASHGSKKYMLQAGALEKMDDIDLGDPVDISAAVSQIHRTWKWKKQ